MKIQCFRLYLFILTLPLSVGSLAKNPDGNRSVQRLAFFQDNLIGTDATKEVNASGLSGGTYVHNSSAIDNLKAHSLASVIAAVTVVDRNQPPHVALTVPADGASFPGGVPITITADVSDPDGTITKVEFFAGLVKIGEDTTAPWSFSWTAAPAGCHVLTAWALDNAGATGSSARCIVTVLKATTKSERGTQNVSASEKLPQAELRRTLGTHRPYPRAISRSKRRLSLHELSARTSRR